MERKLKRVKIYSILLSLALYILSLTQTALTYDDFDGRKTHSSLSVLLMGALAILGGGFLEWIVWLANPLYLFGLLAFARSAKASKKVSMAATLLAFSFVMWQRILAAESGRTAPIKSLNFGYWLWLMSLATLTFGIYRYFKQLDKPTLSSPDSLPVK
ncbi:hypothetical protein [Chryseolinea soli]|uniref:Uncharacterized protein n=1 Tax=Chryseolinea soli TaxID=2321403 RepID=A0A385SUW9_9BACT|nr:hypothetical protein [Chryseolinea soli]AYB33937.1 hypothetical protein D4L85_26650 [Chryseolinea soli]